VRHSGHNGEASPHPANDVLHAHVPPYFPQPLVRKAFLTAKKTFTEVRAGN
jgi:hypothetical protein